MISPEVSDAYTYDVLDAAKHEIRLLYLQPLFGRDAAATAIECYVETVNLDSEPIYEALSYEWGQHWSPLLPITLNGSSRYIRENLWWAMYHLRQDQKPRILWIDAICINQDSNIERNHQVAQMTKIYSSAKNVIAWLGREKLQTFDPYFNEASTALQFLNNFSQLAGGIHNPNCNLNLEIFRRKRRFPTKQIQLDTLVMFCRRTYWTRLWIIQELVLAKNIIIQCGKSSTLWSNFHAISYLFNGCDNYYCFPKHVAERSGLFEISKLRQDRTARAGKTGPVILPNLLNLVNQLHEAECENVRDKVFGLLGLCQKCCQDANLADYGMDIMQIGMRMVEHHYAMHLDLDLGYWGVKALLTLGIPRQNILDLSLRDLLDEPFVTASNNTARFFITECGRLCGKFSLSGLEIKEIGERMDVDRRECVTAGFVEG